MIKSRSRNHYERQSQRGFKESRVWLSTAAQLACDAEVARRTAKGERSVSRQSVLTDIVEASLSPAQADLVELRHELAKARAEIALLEEKVRYGRG